MANASNESDEKTIVVRRHWNDWRKATIRLADFHRPRWDVMSGGIGSFSPKPMVYGYMMCDRILSGELAHSCQHGPGPHEIKVVVCKIDNTKEVNKAVRAAADAE